MTDEEKKVIERFKNFIYTYQDVIEDEYSDYEEKESAKEYQEVSEKIINLIEKQQKEIEELKTDRDKFKKALGKRITYCNELEKDLFENCNNYVVSKDKIKAKIKKLENEKEKYFEKQVIQHEIEVLQSLLEKE